MIFELGEVEEVLHDLSLLLVEVALLVVGLEPQRELLQGLQVGLRTVQEPDV